LDAATGQRVWEYQSTDLLDAQSIATPELLCFSRRERLHSGVSRPRRVWLDPRSGEELGSSPLDEQAGEVSLLGPLVSRADRWWAFCGQGYDDVTRSLVELFPMGSAD